MTDANEPSPVENDPQYTAALAEADRQLAHIDNAVDHLLKDVREQSTKTGRTETCAIVATRIAGELNCASQRQRFAVEMLVALAMRVVQADEHRRADTK